MPCLSVQLGHRHEMPGHVFRQPLLLQLTFPLRVGDVVVGDLTVERLRVLSRDSVHVLRPWPGELVDPA